MKRTTKTIAISIGTFLALVLAAYAVTALFFKSERQGSDFDPGTIFEFEMNNVFRKVARSSPVRVRASIL